MPTYDVHSYRQIRVKACGIEADSPEDAIARIEGDNDFDVEIRRLVNVEGASGPVADVEYQDGGVPVGWLVDPLDVDEDGHGDGIAFDADDELAPIRAHDASKMPSDIQKTVLVSFDVDHPGITDHHDARNVAERLVKIDPLAGALFTLLGGADADGADALLDEAVASIQTLRGRIADEANRPDPRIPPGVEAVLRPYGLKAVYCESTDEQSDDDIDIHKIGVKEPVGGIQVCGDNDFMAGTWTSAAMDERRHGGFRRTAAAAAEDAVALLKRDGWI